jgi:CRISPR-associated protein Cmr6
LIFHDAWWKPEGERLPIHPDVMTVHHADYYTRTENKPPSDMDNPNPSSVCVGDREVSGRGREDRLRPKRMNRPELLDAALCILKLGLEHLGIGAKTNAGYGRMSLA